MRFISGAVSIILGVTAVVMLLLAVPSFGKQIQQEHGITFSQAQTDHLGLPWQEVYEAVLTDLEVKHIRLVAYWDRIEPTDNVFQFVDLDYQMDKAAEADAQVVLAIGQKVPRWPECHIPAWARELTSEERQDEVEEMLAKVVERYRNHSALVMWQLENEPFLNFGECPVRTEGFLKAEEALVRSLDAVHPILVTDSGELNSWLKVSAYGDIVGTTMYRTVFSSRTKDHFHYDYIFPAWMYRLKSRYIKILRGKDVIISELQGEPWGHAPVPNMTAEERQASFSPARFTELWHFARRTGLPRAYWWGVEYWYWEKEVHGNSHYWDTAQTIFAPE